MAKSNLDSVKSQLQEWAQEPGITYEVIAQRLREAGVDTSEASVRRAFKRLKLKSPEHFVHEHAQTDVQRALRDVEGKRTAEDDLRDQLDIVLRERNEALQVIKRLREKQQVEDRIVSAVDSALVRLGKDLGRPVLAKAEPGNNKARPHEMILLVSDAHYGEVVNPEEALGIKYDPEICRKRIEHIRDVTFRYAKLRREAYPINKITIPVLGDMLSGNIHAELEVTNHLYMVEQASEMAHILFNLAGDISEEFPEVEMIVIPGNHPRLFQKPRYKGKFNNWEFMMGKMIEGMAKHGLPDSVKIRVPKDMVYVHEVFGYRLAMMHGDGIKSNSFAGIPFYGMRNQREAVQALMSQTGQERVDMFMIGHWHQHLYWQGECDILINGSIKGGDEYGIGTRMAATPPVQVLLEFHPEHGLTAQEQISLGHI